MAPNTNAEEDNLTCVLYGVRDLRLEQRPIPEPGENEVLLKIQCVGICGSDVHYVVHGNIGNYIVKSPMVIGHEASGIVVKTGTGVTDLSVGDRVAIEPGVSCRKCQFCKIGKYNLCPSMKFCATPPVDGNLTRYFIHAADFCYKLPDHMTLEEGALLEPLSVGVHACKKANITVGSSVLILGAGPIGLATLATAKAMGASQIYITDLTEYRLNLAKDMGATKTIQIKKNDSDEEALNYVRNEMGNELPDVTLDCTGFQQTIKMGIEITKSGGVLVIVGMGASGVVQLPLFNALSREVDIKGVFRYANDYPNALAMIASKQVNLKPLITHHFKIEDSLKAFETAETGAGGAIKVMIHLDETGDS
ncbi:sorbitol dehydrogenase-like [Adelges cooleyi]|uniref:sorbitol dehydrogenase-like n=1 Tax=Adelges cooleyi TaxID=133065 RepID=UPI00217F95E9|nr:sorbitol dehydrogenase-like [Adelges cooleyi]